MAFTTGCLFCQSIIKRVGIAPKTSKSKRQKGNNGRFRNGNGDRAKPARPHCFAPFLFSIEIYYKFRFNMPLRYSIMKQPDETGEPGKDPQTSALHLSRLMPEVYEELRKLARWYMAREKRGPQTLQATALVNEAYLRLMKEKSHAWRNRAHFCAIAANAMREILVEKARAKTAKKRGGSRARVSLSENIPSGGEESIDLLLLHQVLGNLEKQDPKLARIVELRFFGGLTVEETAVVMGSSPVTVKRSWSMAKAWLKREMEKNSEY